MSSIGFTIVFLSFALVLILETGGKLITKDSEKDGESIIKCCPFNQYFNMRTNLCESGAGQAKTITSGSMEWQVPKKLLFKWVQSKNETTNITLKWSEKSGFPPCKKPLETIQLQLNGSFSMGKTKYRLTDKGILVVIQSSSGAGEFKPMKLNHRPKDFCIDISENQEQLVLQICPPQCEKHEPCMRKCCEVGRHLKFDHNEINFDCENSQNTEWKLPFYESPGVPLSKKDQHRIEPRYNSGLPNNCQYAFISSGHSLPDGIGNHQPFIFLHRSSKSNSSWQVHHRLMNKDEEKWTHLKFDDDACYDRLEAHSNFSTCLNEDEVIIYCVSGANENKNNMNDTNNTNNEVTSFQLKMDPWEILYKFMSIVALFFLLITFLILLLHTTTKEVQNIHSWTRLAYVTSFFTVFLLITINAYWTPPIGSKGCAFLGGFIHFMGLTTISWLGVINFDLWYVFKVLKPMASPKLDVKRFLYYVAFALGLPMIIIIIAVIIQSYKPPEGQLICRSKQPDKLIYPNYGKKSCNMSRSALLFYWFIPLGIQLFANFLFLITTTCRVVKLQRMASRASMESTNVNGPRQSVLLFVKIFIVSGISWNIDVISWILKEYLHHSKVKGAWYLLDLSQHFQAIALFVIFVCKRDVLRTLQSKFPIINKVIPQVGAHQSATMASCSTEVNGVVRKQSFVSGSSGTYKRQDSVELNQISPAKSDQVVS